MIFDGSKSNLHEIFKTSKFTETLPLVTAHVLQIARGSSLARSYCFEASGCCNSSFHFLTYLYGAKHCLSGRRLGNPMGGEMEMSPFWIKISEV